MNTGLVVIRCHTIVETSVNLGYFKREYLHLVSFENSPLIAATYFTQVSGVFYLLLCTFHLPVIYDKVGIKDCLHKQ